MCQVVTPYQSVTARMDAHVHTYKINMDVERGKSDPQTNEPVYCTELGGERRVGGHQRPFLRCVVFITPLF